MPIITSVEPQKKKQGRFNIFIDGKFAFGADEDLVVNHRLIPGKVIEPRGFDKLLYEVEIGKLMEKMYGFFSVRTRSEKEVRDYLKNLSFKRKVKDKEEISGLVIDQLVEKLKQKGMLNDLEFAKAWVESRRRSKGKSAKALKMELIKKGIKRDIIEEVVRLQVTGYSEEGLAEKALEKKMKSWKNLDRQTFKKKAYGYLMRQGFEYSLIKSLVEKFLGKRYTILSEIRE